MQFGSTNAIVFKIWHRTDANTASKFNQNLSPHRPNYNHISNQFQLSGYWVKNMHFYLGAGTFPAAALWAPEPAEIIQRRTDSVRHPKRQYRNTQSNPKYNSPTLISSLDYCATEMRNSICTSDKLSVAGSNSDMIKLSDTASPDAVIVNSISSGKC